MGAIMFAASALGLLLGRGERLSTASRPPARQWTLSLHTQILETPFCLAADACERPEKTVYTVTLFFHMAKG